MKSWDKFSYNITRLIYTITHNNFFSSMELLKIRCVFLKAE